MRTQRLSRKSVTLRYNRPTPNVPILVPTRKPKPDGFATFGGPPYEGVQVLLEGDFTNILLHQLSEDAGWRLRSLIKKREEIIEHGDEAFWTNRFSPSARYKRERRKVLTEIGEAIAAKSRVGSEIMQMVGKEESELKMIMGKDRKSVADWLEDPMSYVSREISQKLSKARLVLWWKGEPRPIKCFGGPPRRELRARVAHVLAERNNLLVPAVYCPDLETACYVYELFRFCGRGFGICLECGDIFQKPKEVSPYCSTAHSNAYRIRRWRARKKNARE